MRVLTRRAGLAIGVAMALGVTATVPATATAPPEARSATGPVDHVLVAAILAASWEVTEALDQLGLTAEDLVLPERDDDLYAEVAAGLAAWLDEQDDEVTAAPVAARAAPPARARTVTDEDLLTGERLAYAWRIAQMNAARDRRAGPIERETVYMYLSHYVDTPRGTLPGIDAHSNYDQYYAAWISDDDRMVYDRFLATNAAIEGGNALVDAAKALVGLRNAISGRTSDDLRDWRRALVAADEVFDGTQGLDDAVKAWTTYLGTTSDHPERVVRSLIKGHLDGDALASKQREVALDVLKAVVVAAAVGGGAFAVLGAVALGVAEMAHVSVRSLAQQANYASMISSNRGRVAERMWRFLMGG